MSRVKRFTHSLASGYVVLGASVLSTLASVPLALHYLSKKEFGLWALVSQVSGYLLLIDLGMAGSISRILIDHKDDPAGGAYGAIIKTGALVLAVQGAIIAVAGAVVSLWLPDLFAVPATYRREFQILIAGQCILIGVFFVGRMTSHVLQAHQRYDAWNYSQVCTTAVNLGVMWLGFTSGCGLYSILVAYAASNLVGISLTVRAAVRLKLFPPARAWGHANWKTFHELFSFGRELFLLTVGWQLVNASQVMVISRTLGLDAAAVWSIATKPFTLAQQVVNNLFNYSASAIAEMMVRQERERLLSRCRDLVVLTASLAVWAGLAVGLCSPSFLALWTKGRISWSGCNDWLMALLVILYSTTRCYMGFVMITKEIRAMKYVYALEGASFVGLSLLVVHAWGMGGIIASALVTNFAFSGVYGFWRLKQYFGIRGVRAILSWLRGPLLCLVSLATVASSAAWVSRDWNTYARLGANAAVAALAGFALFWRLGLSSQLRAETASLWRRFWQRLRPPSL
jgi:O-antigen/teichoic acid export membrane protein